MIDKTHLEKSLQLLGYCKDAGYKKVGIESFIQKIVHQKILKNTVWGCYFVEQILLKFLIKN